MRTWLFGVVLALTLSACVGPKVPHYELSAPTAPSPAPTPTPVPPPAPPVVTPLSVVISAVPTNIVAGRAANFCATTQHEHGAVTYAWTFEPDPGVATSGCADHAFQREGAGRVTVVATDETGATASAAIHVSVLAPPVTPTPPPPTTPPPASLSASLTCTPGTHGTTATSCNVTASYGGVTLAGAAITNVNWDWADGPGLDGNSTTPVKSHVYVNPGTYTIFATVTATTTPPSAPVTTSKVVVVP